MNPGNAYPKPGSGEAAPKSRHLRGLYVFPIRKFVQDKKFLNIIHLSPGTSRIDFTSGFSQDAAPSIQLPTSSLPVAVFGGKVSGSPVNFMSIFFFDGIVPLTPAIAKIFKNVFRNPMDGTLIFRGGDPTSRRIFKESMERARQIIS